MWSSQPRCRSWQLRQLQGHASSPSESLRRAFTLIELLVVLAILVTLLAMAWPAMRRSLDRHELTDSAQRVKAQLIRARVRAIETGEAQQFRYQVGGRDFLIAPAGLPIDAEDSWWIAPAQSTRSFPRHTYPPSETFAQANFSGRVAEGVAFVDSAEDFSEGDELPSLRGMDFGGWSPPIIFYPSGRADSASIRLQGRRGFVVDLHWRRATGHVELTPPARPPTDHRGFAPTPQLHVTP